MSRTFHLNLAGERNPILIVADTDEDAMAQAKEAKRNSGKKVITFFEVFEMPLNTNAAFNNIFA